jgi:hypothetical protein
MASVVDGIKELLPSWLFNTVLKHSILPERSGSKTFDGIRQSS